MTTTLRGLTTRHSPPLIETTFAGDPLQWATPQVRHWSGIKQITFFIAACIGSWVAFGAVCVFIYAGYLAINQVIRG